MAGRGQPKTGGRKPGTPNKKQAELLQQIRDHIGDSDFHPVLAMAHMATATEKVRNPETKKMEEVYVYGTDVRSAMLKEVSQYVAPKLKAVEHSAGEDGLGLNLHMNIGTGAASSPGKNGGNR